MKFFNKGLGCFNGLAIGDALGAPVEFKPKGSFPWVDDFLPATNFGLQPGQWTDDTIMAMCLAEAMVEDGRYNSSTVMDNYTKWYNEGYNSPTGRVFDIGIQTSRAINEYKRNSTYVEYTDSAGNGTIMRLAPAVLGTMNLSEFDAAYVFEVSARDTHNSDEAVEATILFGFILRNLILNETFEDSLTLAKTQTEKYCRSLGLPPQNIASRVYNFTDKEVENGGYVIKTLGTAIWSMKTSENFKEAVLKVVNLGRDSDTVAAVTGQMAGALYGNEEIPVNWRENLYRESDIRELTKELLKINKGLGKPRIYEYF